MVPELRTVNAVQQSDTVWERTTEWILVSGNRTHVAGGIVLGITAVVWGLITAGVLAVGPSGYVANLFASGLTAGVVTLLTIALSINQLVLSRVFGSLDTLKTRLNGSRELRQTVESIADVPSSPNDPAAFLALIATTLTERSENVVGSRSYASWNPPATVTTALEEIAAYGESLDTTLGGDTTMNGVLSVVLDPEYAINITAVQHLQTEYAASMPPDVMTELTAIEDLLESVAIVRQFYKTIAIQQDLATLSRLLVYTGVTALVTVICITLMYRTSSTTLPVGLLPVVVSVGIGIIVTPLALFVAYVLRAATVARQTVSVGPFVPPENQH